MKLLAALALGAMGGLLGGLVGWIVTGIPLAVLSLTGHFLWLILGAAFAGAFLVSGAAAGSIRPEYRAAGRVAGVFFGFLLPMGISLPSWYQSPRSAGEWAMKDVMFGVSQGIEQYALDGDGHYPPSLAAADFDWDKFVPHTPRNPYSDAVGRQMVDATIRLESRDFQAFYATVLEDQHPFAGPGRLRYYVSRDRSLYALTGSRDSDRPLKDLDETYVRGNQFDAYKDYRTAHTIAQLSPGGFQPHVDQANALSSAQQWQRAVAEYEAALRLQPNDAEVHHKLGHALSELHRYREAVAHFNQAISLGHDRINAYDELGRALSNLKRHREALAAFQAHMQRNKRDMNAYANDLAPELMELKRYDEAAAVYRDVFQRDPLPKADPGIQIRNHVLGQALYLGHHYKEALAVYQANLQLQPDDPTDHALVGAALAALKQAPAAQAEHRKAQLLIAHRAGHRDEACNNLGLAYYNIELYTEALVQFQQLLKINPRYEAVHHNLGDTLEKLGRKQQAIHEYELYLQAQPRADDVTEVRETVRRLRSKGA